MARVPIFDSPLLLGFDHFERVLDRVAKVSADGYPPYNIEQIGEAGLRITVAVAGISAKDLSVTVEENQLVIRGRGGDGEQDRVFLHKGIAARQFQRSFVLAEGIEVKSADLDSGLLHIDLVRIAPEPRARKIEIRQRSGARAPAGTTIDVAAERGEGSV